MSALSIWTVYDSPRDFPGLFVARRFEGEAPTPELLVDVNLVQLRAKLPPGLYRLPRQPGDDPVIYETWL